MKVAFRLVESKADKSGLCPVFVDFSYSGKRLRYFTGERCAVKDWDVKKMRFRRSFDGWMSANDLLDSLEARLLSSFRNFRANGVIPSVDALRDSLRPKKAIEETTTFVQDFERWIVEKRKRVRENSIKGFEATIRRLERFEAVNGKFYVSNYPSVHDKFVSFQINEGLHPNTVSKTNAYLRCFFNEVTKDLGIKVPVDLPKFVTTEITPDVVFLTVSELAQVKGVELGLSLSKIRDAFLFSCYTGLRYSDLRGLRPNQIFDKGSYQIIELIPDKSRSRSRSVKRVEIPLLPDAVEIMKRYEGGFNSLPVVSNQSMNYYLKEIAEKAGLNALCQVVTYKKGFPVVKFQKKWELVTVHVARHTFATLSLIKGVPIEIIQKVLGHSDLQTTMRYAKIVDEYKNAVILGAWSE